MKKNLLSIIVLIFATTVSAQVKPSLGISKKPLESKLNISPIITIEGFSALQNTDRTMSWKASTTIRKAPSRKEATPTGTPEWYTIGGNFYVSGYGVFHFSGLADQVSIDGNDVYFKTLFPRSYEELWTKGTLNEAGDEVTISMDVLTKYKYNDDITYDLAPCELVLDSTGNQVEGVKPIVMKKDGNHIYIEDDASKPSRYIVLGVFSDGQYLGMADYAQLTDLNKVEQELNPVEVPVSAVNAQYVYKYTNATGINSATQGNVAIDGNDYYFDYLAEGYGWVKGTREGNKISIPSGQFLGTDSGYFLFFNNCQNFGSDENGNVTFDIIDNFTMTVNDNKYTQTVYDDTPTLTTIDGQMYTYTFDYTLEPFEGLTPAVPANPYNVYISDSYLESHGTYTLAGMTPNVDINGKYIDPTKMEIAIWEDGDILTLSPDDGYDITEPITWMPFGWMDNNNGMDLAYISLSTYFLLYEELFNELGLQVRYTVDGITNYSDIVYADIEGNTRIVSGIKEITPTISQGYGVIFNLAGQRVGSNFKGIAIKNGKKMLMK